MPAVTRRCLATLGFATVDSHGDRPTAEIARSEPDEERRCRGWVEARTGVVLAATHPEEGAARAAAALERGSHLRPETLLGKIPAGGPDIAAPAIAGLGEGICATSVEVLAGAIRRCRAGG